MPDDDDINNISKKNKKIKKIKKSKEKLDKKPPIDPKLQLQILIKHIKLNYIFYIVITICLFTLSRAPKNTKSIFSIFASFAAIIVWGYCVHVTSHKINFRELYDNYNIITKNFKFGDNITKKILAFYDFHDTMHHNSDVNKTWRNIFLEAVNNIFMQGLCIVICGTIYNLLDWRIFIFWALFYASFHMINYSIIKPSVHIDHHNNKHMNTGIDVMDIIMGTKYDWNDLENYNHYSINAIILTYIFYKLVY
jgi:hypothetical protein